LTSVRLMLVQYIRTAQRRWRIGVGVSSLICIIGLAAVYEHPDQFESTARLYVDLDAILKTNLDSGDAPLTRTEILRYALLYKTNLEMLLGGCPLMIPDLCLPRGSEQKMAQIMAGITVSQQTKRLFLIAYRQGDPVETRNVLRALLKIFIQTTDDSDSQRRDQENARRSLEGQVHSCEQQLRATEKRRADFLLRHRDVFGDDPNPGAVDWLPRGIAVLDDRLRDALVRQDAVRSELDKTLPLLPPDAYVPQPSRPNPDYIRMRGLALEADVIVASLTRQRDEARARLARLQQISQEQPDLLTECRNIERDYTTLRKSYEELLGRLQVGHIWRIPGGPLPNASVEEAKIQIVDPPEVPRMPTAPSRPIMIFCVILVAPIVGFAISGLFPARSRHVRNRQRQPTQGVVLGPKLPPRSRNVRS
jgi:uncharacterized protein involved in exopolysaccharide biosynthesis